MGKKDKEKLESLEGLEGATVEARPDPGPLAPWRLSIAVAASAALVGMPLYDAAMTGVGVDMALLRAFGVAFFVWVAVGFVNKVLRQAQAVHATHDVGSPEQLAAPRAWVDERVGDSGSATA